MRLKGVPIMLPTFIVLSFLLLQVHGQLPDELPLLNITQGMVVGSLAADGDYYQFFGIPYADSTSGSRRFQAPVPAPSFQDTFIADRRNVKCIRALGVGYEGTEDCLVANVFTPSIDSNNQLPVMVWIKGREFDKTEELELSFRNFMEQDVVVVQLNFRESILGFLCLGTETAPGNAGLKDIIQGLRWVQENIATFGGNPNDVTLFGHGSGAAAVDLVTLSPLSEGLIHKAIAQSGSAISPWAVSRDPTRYAILVAEALGHTVTDVETLSEIFKRTSVAALMGILNELEIYDNSLAFSPCIENENLEGDEKFLVRSPFETIVEGNYIQIPFVIGFVENEGTIRTDEALDLNWLEKMESSFTDFIQPDLKFESEEDATTAAQEIRNFYFGNAEISLNNIENFIRYHGDTMILVSAIREAHLRAVSSSVTYMYQFSYQGALGEPFVSPLSLVGAGHGEELGYLFVFNTNSDLDIPDVIMSNILVERWTNFAKTGQPTSEISLITWLPVTPENTNILMFRNEESDDITEEDTLIENLEITLVNPYPETLAFWNGVYDRFYDEVEGVWTQTGRDDDDDEGVNVVEENEELNVSEELIVVDDSDENLNIEDTNETTEEPETSAASTAVGCTFLIIPLFTVLNYIHSNLLGKL